MDKNDKFEILSRQGYTIEDIELISVIKYENKNNY